MYKNRYFNVLAAFSVQIWFLEQGKICKNNDHTYFFHCINTCLFHRTVLEHSAYRSRVQTASSVPGKYHIFEIVMKNGAFVQLK